MHTITKATKKFYEYIWNYEQGISLFKAAINIDELISKRKRLVLNKFYKRTVVFYSEECNEMSEKCENHGATYNIPLNISSDDIFRIGRAHLQHFIDVNVK